MEQQLCKRHNKRDRFLVSKVDYDFQIYQRDKNITYWSIFRKLGYFFQNNGTHNFFLKLKEIFLFMFFKFTITIFSQITISFGSFHCSLALFQLYIGYICLVSPVFKSR